MAIVSGLFSGGAVFYARRSVIVADRSADAAAVAAGLDSDRRHAELTPRFRVTVQPSNPGSETLRMGIYLLGPPELQRLDALTVTIRDDHPWRAQRTPLAAGPTPKQIAEQIWGRWRFNPGTGPGADSVKGIPGADPTGRTTPTGGLPVGEELPVQLEPNWPPRWSQQPLDAWQQQMGPWLRLRLECRRDGHATWVLPCEMKIEDGVGFAEIPSQFSQ